jgi:glycosyltransferase involved in cell wall biosynthesis
MTDKKYYDMIASVPNTDLVRPFYIDYEYHKKAWQDKSITVLICQRKTRDMTRLCLESLLQLYPDIPILVVDGNSEDDSSLYLKTKAALYNNITVWNRVGINSHGITMDEAIRQYITTKYVLLMDSDIIVERGGWIEGMWLQLEDKDNLYATGTLMLVTRKGEACGIPEDDADVLRYAHPSCAMYKVDKYKELRPFTNHGAPCVYNLIDAENEGLDIGYYPVEKYVSHLSGASWCIPKTIWNNGRNVFVRPFISFIVSTPIHLLSLKSQTDQDYDIHNTGLSVVDKVVIHGSEPQEIDNNLYDIRFNVTGEYVCELGYKDSVDKDFVKDAKNYIIVNGALDRFYINGVEAIKRSTWQSTNALKK